MQFFDEKEDVLEMIVTPYGRHLLSLGRFSPEYYAFFDDDILYDSSCVGLTGSFREAQNDIEGRIQQNTARIRQPTAYTGIETSVNQSNELILTALDFYGFDPTTAIVAQDTHIQSIYNQSSLQRYGDQFEFLSLPLGTSELSSKYLPTWKVIMLDGQISSSSGYYARLATGGAEDTNTTGSIYQIPQINITLNYQLYVEQLDEGSILNDVSADINYNQVLFETPTAPNVLGGNPDYAQGAWQSVSDTIGEEMALLSSQLFPDNTHFTLKDGKVVIEIQENNTLYKKENFDIQVFLSSSTGLELLNYAALDAESYNIHQVEKYLTIRADREIEASTLKDIGASGLIAMRSDSLTSDSTTTNVISTREFLIRDLYEPDPEICD